jgi:tRNA(fMet)-specific endonuclease VapC
LIVLDTDICVELLRGNRQIVQRRRETKESLAISFLTVGELHYGVAKSAAPDANRRQVATFLESLPIIHTTDAIMRSFGVTKGELELQGIRLPDADLLIAATALTARASLATGNTRHFERIQGLHLLNWLE